MPDDSNIVPEPEVTGSNFEAVPTLEPAAPPTYDSGAGLAPAAPLVEAAYPNPSRGESTVEEPIAGRWGSPAAAEPEVVSTPPVETSPPPSLSNGESAGGGDSEGSRPAYTSPEGAVSADSLNFYNPPTVQSEGNGAPSYRTGGEVQQVADAITREVHKAVVGQDDAIESAIAAMLADGHVLLEGVPGTAKTLLVRALSMAVSAEFRRIQFTPDLMPSDITGTRIFDQKAMEFVFKPGPIFAGLLLADEVNRTPPKTQAALLEAMQEHRVTIDGEPHDLPRVFLVFATQNPIEFEGTYPLPEAQLDRFLLKVLISYPSADAELTVLRRYHEGFDANDLVSAGIQPVADVATIERCRQIVTQVVVEDAMFKYISSLVIATREHRHLVLGAGPRASIALLQVGKAYAAMRGRNYLIPDDVKSIAPAVLRHRLLLRPEAEIEGITADSVIEGILSGLEVPR